MYERWLERAGRYMELARDMISRGFLPRGLPVRSAGGRILPQGAHHQVDGVEAVHAFGPAPPEELVPPWQGAG